MSRCPWDLTDDCVRGLLKLPDTEGAAISVTAIIDYITADPLGCPPREKGLRVAKLPKFVRGDGLECPGLRAAYHVILNVNVTPNSLERYFVIIEDIALYDARMDLALPETPKATKRQRSH
jgi:hypothetical protein